jgi:hypothetical protein
MAALSYFLSSILSYLPHCCRVACRGQRCSVAALSLSFISYRLSSLISCLLSSPNALLQGGLLQAGMQHGSSLLSPRAA